MNQRSLFQSLNPAYRRSSALLITLLMLSLITIIAVALLGTMTWETSAARRNYENQRAQALATLGLDMAVGQLRSALGGGTNSWDNPYANFATNPPTFYWSVSPGLITRWSYTNSTPQATYALFSIGSTNLVNLNAAESDGSSPIAGITNTAMAGATAPNISVYWVNVLKTPGTTAPSSANPIIGRYAFWIDDENAKINVNTADGTMKYQTTSLGLGSPSEVSLQALQQGGANLSATAATNIVYLARTSGLNSPREILRAAGTTPDLYTNNVFNLTAYSRSPDLNVFGQPKASLTPVLGDSAKFYSTPSGAFPVCDMILDSMTLQPSHNIYPTPSQLPPYGYNVPQTSPSHGVFVYHPVSTTTKMWTTYPLAFRGAMEPPNSGVQQPLAASQTYQVYAGATNYAWIGGMMLAQYLAGTNAAGKLVTWPALPGSSTSGFAGKYTYRQIDCIVAQIASIGAKEISPDIPFGTNQDTYVGTGLGTMRGLYSYDSPFIFDGWLSNEWVIGMGRTPKVTAMEIEAVANGAIGSPTTNTASYYPSCNLDQWIEWWMPANYLGGRNDIINTNATGFQDGIISNGQSLDPTILNQADMMQDDTATANGVTYAAYAAGLVRSDYAGTNFWGNQLLANDQGADFQCNPGSFKDTWISTNASGVPLTNAMGLTTTNNAYPRPDPDQAMAAQYHAPYAWNTNINMYVGTGKLAGNGISYDAALTMTYAQTANKSSTTWKDWQPGELRCTRDYGGLGGGLPMIPMWTNAGSAGDPNLNITGGIQIRAYMNSTPPSEPDPVPLEAIRADGNPSGSFQQANVSTGEPWATSPATPIAGDPLTLRSRFMQEVIPVNFSIPVPAPNSDIAGNTEYEFIKVADPLVNKFPGDWTMAGGATVSVSAGAPNVPAYWALSSGSNATNLDSTTEYNANSAIGGVTFHQALAANNGDPDSYWLPQADVPLCYTNDVAKETIIPRSARCPNIGYLQYIRTGIMPDTPTPNTPALEHGTPFRLLSYAPLSDPGNQKTTASGSQVYPDWALIDLLYMPSTLAPFGGPYGYYNINGVWQGYGTPSVLTNYSTGGGSTPGRINPNGAVIYTTNVSTPQPGVARTVPLQALVHGLMVNQSISPTATSLNPIYTGGTAVDDSVSESDASSIPVAIESYIRANGPLHLPGELCDVPAIAALRASANPTRNDLIRQIIGNVTTQSDTFSVWVAGESILKSKGNTGGLSSTDPNWGSFQSGDQVMASARYHFVVERYLDPGADGIYGNSANPSAVSSYNDPLNLTYHPFQPHYLYRVVFAEEIR